MKTKSKDATSNGHTTPKSGNKSVGTEPRPLSKLSKLSQAAIQPDEVCQKMGVTREAFVDNAVKHLARCCSKNPEVFQTVKEQIQFREAELQGKVKFGGRLISDEDETQIRRGAQEATLEYLNRVACSCALAVELLETEFNIQLS